MFVSYDEYSNALLYRNQIVRTTLTSASCFQGHKGNRRRIQITSTDGVSCSPAPAHARVLAERAQRAAQVQPDRQHAGQTDPQPEHTQEDGRRDKQITQTKVHGHFF